MTERTLDRNNIDDGDVVGIEVVQCDGDTFINLQLSHKYNHGGILLFESEINWLLDEVRKK